MKIPYIRVGTDYYKIIVKKNRYGIKQPELAVWKKDTITMDHGKEYFDKIPKYEAFTMEPDNLNYKQVVDNCYNHYKPFVHKPIEGEWKWTEILLKHIFDEQYDIGLTYMQVLYLYPRQVLPVLALVSKTRQTGKSTFIDWLTAIFSQNMVIINPEDLKSGFNSSYAYSNIIAVEETSIDKTSVVEKVKALSTQKTMMLNPKFVNPYNIPFFGKVIMASNNERKFMKIEKEEIRFLVRKINTPTIENHNILNDIIKEIPAFLHYLTTLPAPDLTKSRMVFTAKELRNSSLEQVMDESREGLHKELDELFTDFFYNNKLDEDHFYASPIDIKDKFFHHNNHYQSPYIKKILIEDFKFEKCSTITRYKPFGFGETKTGRPYKIPKDHFINQQLTNTIIEDEELPF